MKKTYLQDVNKDNIFRTPPDFFEQNRQKILKKVGIEGENLPFPKENVFQVPPKFFAKLPQAVQERIALRRRKRIEIHKKMRILTISTILVMISVLFFWKAFVPVEKSVLGQVSKNTTLFLKKFPTKTEKLSINIQYHLTKVEAIETYKKPLPQEILVEPKTMPAKVDAKAALQNIPRQEIIAYLHDESEINEAEIIDFALGEEQEAAGDFLDSLDIPKEWILEELNTEELEDLLWEE